MKRNKIVRTLALTLGILSLPVVSNNTLIKDSGIIQQASASTEAPTEVTQDGIKYLVYSDHAEVKGGTSSAPGNAGATGNLVIVETVNGKPVTSIGGSAFYNCTSITNITIPDSVTSIGDWAFQRCTGLTNITIPDSVTSIGKSAFSGCTNLKDITIPDSLTDIEHYTFAGCNSIASITIPDSVTSIGDSAFSGCTNLKDITIPDSIISIGNYAFQGCGDLTSITIPSFHRRRIDNIGLTSSCTVNYTEYLSDDNFEYLEDGKGGLVVTPKRSTDTELEIPSEVNGKPVTSIADYAFYDCTSLADIIIPDTIISIGNSAFSYCKGLTSITIPDGVTSIEDRAFCYCISLKDITIPDSVTSIGGSAFYNCTGLASITIPNSVTSIGTQAFYKCTGLTNITIPNSVTSIGGSAFSGCTSLKDITIPDNVKSIENYTFNNCTSLTNITIPDSVTSIGDSAFTNCISLTSIEAKNVTSIGTEAFKNCTNLKVVSLDKGLVDGTKPTDLTGDWYRVYLSDKNNDTLASYWVKSGTDFTTYASEIGTAWNKISGTGEMTNISSDLEFKLTGELVGTEPEQKLESPTLNISNQTPSNRKDIQATIE